MPQDDVLQQMGEAFDRHLLHLLQSGEADSITLNTIRGRLRDCKVTGVPSAGSTLGKITEAMQDRGLKFVDPNLPPLDDEPDAATA